MISYFCFVDFYIYLYISFLDLLCGRVESTLVLFSLGGPVCFSGCSQSCLYFSLDKFECVDSDITHGNVLTVMSRMVTTGGC